MDIIFQGIDNPAARKMLQWFDEEFEAFGEVGIDNAWIWPYDQGGCACERCNPWGGYGANPIPAHLQDLWDAAGNRLSGGFPCSEGIYHAENAENPVRPLTAR